MERWVRIATWSLVAAWLVGLWAAYVSSPGSLSTAAAQSSPAKPPRLGGDCSTPRAAVNTWLTAFQPGVDDMRAATLCFDWKAAGIVGKENKIQLARRLKQTLDARGVLIDIDVLPDTQEVQGDGRVLMTARYPELWLFRFRGAWLISAESIQRIPDLYSETFTVDVASIVRALPSWTREAPAFGIAWWQLLGLLLSLLIGLGIKTVIRHIVATQGMRLIRRAGDGADADVISLAAQPIGTLVMAAFLWQALPLLSFSVRVNQVGTVAIRVLAAIAAVVLVYRLVDVGSNIFQRRAERTETKLDDQLVPLVRRSLKIFVVAIGVLFVLQNMDVDVSSLIAGASLGGLAFSLAARDTVANLFGSVSIFADRPFQVGDWVVIKDHEGIVEEVGMRSTRIRTFYNSLVTVPNSIVANTAVDNYGMRQFRRCSVTLGITYDSTPEQIQAFVEGIRAILKTNEFVRQDLYEVHFRDFGESGLEVMVYFFFNVRSWSEELRQRHNVFLEIIRLARELGVSFAFPTRTLHVDSMATASPLPDPFVPEPEELKNVVHGFGPGGRFARPEGPHISHGFLPGDALPESTFEPPAQS